MVWQYEILLPHQLRERVSMIRIESFQENTVEELESSINELISKIDDIRVLSLSMSETDYLYKAHLVYEIKND